MQFEPYDNYDNYDHYEQEAQVAAFMTRTYVWMVMGLIVCAMTSYLPIVDPAVATFVLAGNGLIISTAVMFIIVIAFPFLVRSRTPFFIMLLLYLIFTGATGIMISMVHLLYSQELILIALGATGGLFVIMAVWGTVTKKDLTGAGALLSMALLGIIITSALNFWIRSPFIYYLVSWVAIVVFMGLIAYDAQKLRNYAHKGDGYALLGAMGLFLNFINLFLRILQVLARAKGRR